MTGERHVESTTTEEGGSEQQQQWRQWWNEVRPAADAWGHALASWPGWSREKQAGCGGFALAAAAAAADAALSPRRCPACAGEGGVRVANGPDEERDVASRLSETTRFGLGGARSKPPPCPFIRLTTLTLTLTLLPTHTHRRQVQRK